jgi:hypothetical protein
MAFFISADMFNGDYGPDLSSALTSKFVDNANGIVANHNVANHSDANHSDLDAVDEPDLANETDLDTDLNAPKIGVAEVEELADDLKTFVMKTSPMEMNPSTPTTEISILDFETPPGSPNPFAGPIANKEEKVAKKRLAKDGPFWCTHIGCTHKKPFPQKVNMESHVKSVHLKIKHKCSICNKDYSSTTNLSHHIKKTHAPPGQHGALMHCAICNLDMRGDMARHCRTKAHRRARIHTVVRDRLDSEKDTKLLCVAEWEKAKYTCAPNVALLEEPPAEDVPQDDMEVDAGDMESLLDAEMGQE